MCSGSAYKESERQTISRTSVVYKTLQLGECLCRGDSAINILFCGIGCMPYRFHVQTMNGHVGTDIPHCWPVLLDLNTSICMCVNVFALYCVS